MLDAQAVEAVGETAMPTATSTATSTAMPAPENGHTRAPQEVPTKETVQELMAPGHPYNPRTGTGIEWLPAVDAADARDWSRYGRWE